MVRSNWLDQLIIKILVNYADMLMKSHKIQDSQFNLITKLVSTLCLRLNGNANTVRKVVICLSSSLPHIQ